MITDGFWSSHFCLGGASPANHRLGNALGINLPPLNPVATTLGFENASFVAQTVDWNPAHLLATLELAYEHRMYLPLAAPVTLAVLVVHAGLQRAAGLLPKRKL